MRKSQVNKLSLLLIKLHIFYKWDSHRILSIPGIVICMIFVSFCNPSTEGRIPPDKDLFRYDLGSPAARYKLPAYLKEISGLSYYGNGKIACVQDEKANIYIWNLEKEIIQQIRQIKGDIDEARVAEQQAERAANLNKVAEPP